MFPVNCASKLLPNTIKDKSQQSQLPSELLLISTVPAYRTHAPHSPHQLTPPFTLPGKEKAKEAGLDQTVQSGVLWAPLGRATSSPSSPSEGLSCGNWRLQNCEEKRSHHVAALGPHRALIMRQVASLEAVRLAHKSSGHQKPPRCL